jgi:antitoxin (DNA-binding transcriptional repressor) of toxin-antitoxin stability system
LAAGVTTHTVGEFKAHFASILERVKRGEKVAVCYGRARKPVALLVPPDYGAPVRRRRLGPLERKAGFRLKAGFKMTDEELLGS